MKQIEKEVCTLSVIIPIYNVEKTLERAVDSILNQVGLLHYEIILVDDGSTDTSGSIADAYGKKYSFIKVFHKKNGGLSSARNYGIKKANGKILAFLDSDDYLFPTILQDGLLFFERESVDIVVFGLEKGTETVSKKIEPEEGTSIDSAETITKLFLDKGAEFYAWNKLYKKELFKNVQYPEGHLYEDVIPTYEVMKQAKKVKFMGTCGIFYYQNEDSIVYQKFNAQQYDNVEQRKILLSKISKEFPELTGLAVDKLIDGYLSTGFKLTMRADCTKEKKEFLSKARKEIRSNYGKFLFNKQTSIYKKAALSLLLVQSYVYNGLYRLLLKK
uniref:Glycosyltransferase 2-like domain-containing protein n=1 Tax=Candidatus Enterococcus mansonii TaxID=1834181 RepID=A0A242CHZ3_9ENTE|nr:hypothetical protein A5880_000429 [Enterococcus sp. 4G2_DIV0659]